MIIKKTLGTFIKKYKQSHIAIVFILFTLFLIGGSNAFAVTACDGLISSNPCKDKGGLQEVPNSETAGCPKNYNFEGCSNKPASGSGVVLCCYNPENVSTGAPCEPKETKTGMQYLCMTPEGCGTVSGKTVDYKDASQKCTGNGAQTEICCETKARTGVTQTDASPVAKTYKLTNPLGTSNLNLIAKNVINVFLGIVGALALLVFVYAGISYMVAGGTEGKVTKAKDTMKYAVIGVFVIMFSFVLTDTFISLWTVDIGPPAISAPDAALDAPTEAEQNVVTIKEQQQAAKKAEDDAKAAAKSSNSDVCGQTPATTGYSCQTLTTAEQAGYDCVSGYCQSNSSNNYLCCKKK